MFFGFYIYGILELTYLSQFYVNVDLDIACPMRDFKSKDLDLIGFICIQKLYS